MFVLKCRHDTRAYIVSAPRYRRPRFEGCLYTENKSSALKFETAEQAREWIADVRQKQADVWGVPVVRRASAYPVRYL